ncbi:MAG: Asp-tRNA(Asn)/Glu-tRNA(Gln) amidotransferase subunit GatC [Thermodesulfobacteriota bacterium]
MKISNKDVKEVADLARLEIEEEQLDKFTNQFENILKFISKLDELNTDDVDPTSHVLDMPTPLREDKVEEWLSQDEALKNAPQREDKFFGVPKVIED